MQQIVKCLKTEGHPEKVQEHLEEIFPWFEVNPQEEMAGRPSPRIYKSHRWEKGDEEGNPSSFQKIFDQLIDIVVGTTHTGDIPSLASTYIPRSGLT